MSSEDAQDNDKLLLLLHKAAGSGQTEILEENLKYIRNDVNIDLAGANGLIMLLAAAEAGHHDCVRILLENGADPTTHTNQYKNRPVFMAASGGHAECLRLLIDAFRDRGMLYATDEPSEDIVTPLFLAAQSGHYDCVKLLLDNGADAAKTYGGYNDCMPLAAAVIQGHFDCIELLWNSRDKKVWRKFHAHLLDAAISRRQGCQMVEKLIHLGCCPDTRLVIPKWDHFRKLKLAPLSCYNFHDRNSRYDTLLPLHYDKVSAACIALSAKEESGEQDVALMILKHMVSIEPEASECPILFFAIVLSQRMPTVFKELISVFKLGLDYYYPDWLVGNLSLMFALSRPIALLALLKCGAEVDSMFDLDDLGNVWKTCLGSVLTTYPFVTNPDNNNNDDDDNENPWGNWMEMDFNNAAHPMEVELIRVGDDGETAVWSKAAVLRLLLEFAGNVKLDPALQAVLSESQWAKLSSFTDNPRSLVHLCRHKVRRCLGSRRLRSAEYVMALNLPRSLRSYVLFEDLNYVEVVQLMEITP